MRALTAGEILEHWELGQRRGSGERALAVLARLAPDVDADGPGALTLGARDQLLVAAYRASFGEAIEGMVACPSCGLELELELEARDLQTAAATSAAGDFAHLDYHARVRAVDGRDLAAAVGSGDVDNARRIVLERCCSVGRGGEPVAVADLPPAVCAALAARLEELDPGAELRLHLACPECRHDFVALVDPSECLSQAMSARAAALLDEVETLAQAFGWSEREILALGEPRRRHYLERVRARTGGAP